MIGEAFERVVLSFIRQHLQQYHTNYEILAPEEGRQIITLQTFGGTLRRLDTVIVHRDSIEPVALLETKWLKDARHHNDKGAWILQLREIGKQYSTVRGAVAILAGYWTEGVGLMLESNAGVRMILVATDEEVYSTLQQPLNEYLGDETFVLDPGVMRKSYPYPHHLANLLINLMNTNQLDQIAASWMQFPRTAETNNEIVVGGDLVRQAIDELLAPLPLHPKVTSLEIALQIDTGNTIYQRFDDIESAIEFIQTHFSNPEAILRRITPKKSD
jgi:hypothetical protein